MEITRASEIALDSRLTVSVLSPKTKGGFVKRFFFWLSVVLSVVCLAGVASGHMEFLPWLGINTLGAYLQSRGPAVSK